MKLDNFPSTYYTSLRECEDRRVSIESQFNEYGVTNLTAFVVDRFSECKEQYKYSGKYLHSLDDGGIGAVISHLSNIKDWYTNTTEEYAFFCEDDISLETVQYWSFTWSEFINSLPLDWDCVQLLRINNWNSGHEEDHELKLRVRNWNDWGATYLIKRSYAKKIVESYCPNDEFTLDIRGADIQPIIENILYFGMGKVYTLPLFVENVSFKTTFQREYVLNGITAYDVLNGLKNDHLISYTYQSNLWKECGLTTPIKDIIPQTHNLSVSKKSKPRVFVVDDFYDDPYSVRDFALQQNYYDQTQNIGGFIGRRTREQFLFPELREAFENIIGRKITKWGEYSMNGRFQNCYAGEPLVYHCDDQTLAGMLYLTPNAPFETGTTMYAHKRTRIRHSSHPDIMNTFNETILDRTPYEPVDVIGNVFNRLVIFDAGCIHAASEYFGSNIHNCRLWQMFFFD
jgi:hypothetical protein